ncbi:MAG: PTS sugar transporter subunit IIA [Spirochaetales bacterium]|nr:PTS sugar transporter subunit IIA [Spirochaetales bacterium]
MELYEILNLKSCTIDMKVKTKEEVLRSLADLAGKSGLLGDVSSDEVYEKIAKRESQGSTGFGNEIAIPHARIKGLSKFVVYVAVCRKGVDFDAMDKKKVKLFFVIIGPDEAVNEHLMILASISRTIRGANVKNELLKAVSDTALFETFLRHSRGTADKSTGRRKMKLMYINLYVEDFLYDILEFFIQEGIEGATIFESFGMGQYISSIPLFADFIGFMKENKNQSKTIFALIPADKVQDIIHGIEEITGDLDKKEGAMIMTLDIDFYKGNMQML